MLRRNVNQTVILTQNQVNIFFRKWTLRRNNHLMEKIDNPFLQTLRIPVKKSPILHFIVSFLHITCLIMPWVSAIPIAFKIILTVFLIVSFYFHLAKFKESRSDQRPVELILNSKDEWQVKMRKGQVFTAELAPYLFVHPWLTIITLNYEGRRDAFILTSETLDAELFRRLRVRLRFKVVPEMIN